MFRKEDAKHYWDKHFPCPAVFVPTAEVIAKSNQAWPVPAGDLANANSDVTIMDWSTLAICRQIAYRENRPELADRLLQEFLLRVAKLRKVNMLGLPLPLK